MKCENKPSLRKRAHVNLLLIIIITSFHAQKKSHFGHIWKYCTSQISISHAVAVLSKPCISKTTTFHEISFVTVFFFRNSNWYKPVLAIFGHLRAAEKSCKVTFVFTFNPVSYNIPIQLNCILNYVFPPGSQSQF